jgi:hypothetical protein
MQNYQVHRSRTIRRRKIGAIAAVVITAAVAVGAYSWFLCSNYNSYGINPLSRTAPRKVELRVSEENLLRETNDNSQLTKVLLGR